MYYLLIVERKKREELKKIRPAKEIYTPEPTASNWKINPFMIFLQLIKGSSILKLTTFFFDGIKRSVSAFPLGLQKLVKIWQTHVQYFIKAGLVGWQALSLTNFKSWPLAPDGNCAFNAISDGLIQSLDLLCKPIWCPTIFLCTNPIWLLCKTGLSASWSWSYLLLIGSLRFRLRFNQSHRFVPVLFFAY